MPEEKIIEEAGNEKLENKPSNENNTKQRSIQDGIKIISRKERKIKY